MVRSTGGKRFEMRVPGLERLVSIARTGGIFLIPPTIFWIVFVLSVFGIWGWPLSVWMSMPEFVQALGLVLCPILTLVSGIIRLRWDRGSPRRIQAATKHTILSGLYLLLTVLALVRAA